MFLRVGGIALARFAIGDTGIVKQPVAEQRGILANQMTVAAPAVPEHIESALRIRAERILLTTEKPAIEGRVRRQQYALVTGQRTPERAARDSATKCRTELLFIYRYRPDPLQHLLFAAIAHFIGRQQGKPDLLFEAGFATIVKQLCSVGHVIERGRIASHHAPLETYRGCQLILRKALLGDMAHRTRQRAIGRQAAIEEKSAPEVDHRRVRHLCGKRRQSQRGVHGKLVKIHRAHAHRVEALRTGDKILAFITGTAVTGSQFLRDQPLRLDAEQEHDKQSGQHVWS